MTEEDRADAREGLVKVPAGVAALAAYVVHNGGICHADVHAFLIRYGLAVQTTFDPAQHKVSFEIEAGEPFIQYSTELREALQAGGRHLGPWNGRLQ